MNSSRLRLFLVGVLVLLAVGIARLPRSSTPSAPVKAEVGTLHVQVVDEKGWPVAHASVRPIGMRTQEEPGSDYGWNMANAGGLVIGEPLYTDANGNVSIPYPLHVFDNLHTGAVTVLVRHPDFCSIQQDVNVDMPLPVQLKKGTRLTLRATSADGKLLPDVYADVSDERFSSYSLQWTRSADGKSISASFAPGSYVVRAVVLPQGVSPRDRPPLFSAATDFTAMSDSTQTLTLAVQPGTSVRGQLDDSVPRPVRKGLISACVLTPWPDALPHHSENGMPSWDVSVPIAADGSFVLHDLPPGTLEIVALCDGYVSRQPPGTEGLPTHFANIREARRFPVDSPAPIIVPMEPAGSMRITVLKPDGKPLANAEVFSNPNEHLGGGNTILGASIDSAVIIPWHENGETSPLPGMSMSSQRFHAVTDADGVARIDDLPAGPANFMVYDHDFDMPIQSGPGPFTIPRRESTVTIIPRQEVAAQMTMEPKGSTSLSAAVRQAMQGLRASSPTAMTGQPLAVKPGLDFTGKVTDAAGHPLAGVSVHAWTWCPGNQTTTGPDGAFRLTGLEPGRRIEVRFSKDGFSPVHITQQEVGELLQPVALNDKTFFFGTVEDKAGKPLANVTVQALTMPKQADGVLIRELSYQTTTDALGHYRLYVHPDFYRIEARLGLSNLVADAPYRFIRDQQTLLDLVLARGLTFRARIVDSSTGRPISGVRLFNERDPKLAAVSGDSGEVNVPGMVAGNFEVEVSAETLGYRRWWSDQAVNPWEKFQVGKSGWQRNFDSLTFPISRDAPVFVIKLEKGVRIRGKVIDPNGQPVAGASVAPALTGTGNSLTGDTRFSVLTQTDGTFEMLLPASGTLPYNLMAHDGAYGQWRKWANGVLPPIKTLPGQVIDGVVLTLQKPCVVKGRVVAKDGTSVAGHEVRAQSAEQDQNRYYDPTTRTKDDGTFELDFVGPGRQYIQAAPFWLKAEEAPAGTSALVEAKETAASGNVLLKIDDSLSDR